MKFDIPRIIRHIDLADYADELRNPDGSPARIQVWVNPTRELLDRYAALMVRWEQIEAIRKSKKEGSVTRETIDELGGEFMQWYAELWSQAPDKATHWTVDEIKQVASHETDPGLWPFLTARTWDLINEHRDAHRKK